MFLLDLLAKYGPYAFVLMNVWFIAAFVVAAWRVRHFRTRQCIKSLLLLALGCLLWSFMILLESSYLHDFEPGWRLPLEYFVAIGAVCFPLIWIAHTRQRPLPAWRKAGYEHLSDVLLFGIPYTTEIVEEEFPTERDQRINRLVYVLVIDIAFLLAVIVFLANSLRPCEWLDVLIQYTSCVP